MKKIPQHPADGTETDRPVRGGSFPVASSFPPLAAEKNPGRAKIKPKDALLLPYQTKWVKDASRLKIAEKSRQIGWTWATAYGIVSRKAIKSALHDGWISSRDDIQARLFLEDCKHFAALLDKGAKDLGERTIDDGGHSAYVLQMANNLRLHSMSSNPDAQAGKRGDRVLDEFALHPDPRKLYSIAYPGITWGGSLEIFSTHRGSANFFNSLIGEVKHKNNPKGFSLHRVTLQDALDQGFLAKLQTKLPQDDPRQEMDEADYFTFIRSGCADEESFQEEFCCNPSDDNSAFLSYDLIASCLYPADEIPQKITKDTKEFYLGVDVGRDKDLTVIVALERIGDVLHTRDLIELSRQSFDAQEAALYELLALPGCRRCCIDQTGIGRQFTERAQQRFGKYKVEGLTYTGALKEELAFPLRSRFEDRTIRLYNDRILIADMRSIRKTTTASGNIRFEGERTVNGHADRFWAYCNANHAAKQSNSQFWAQII